MTVGGRGGSGSSCSSGVDYNIGGAGSGGVCKCEIGDWKKGLARRLRVRGWERERVCVCTRVCACMRVCGSIEFLPSLFIFVSGSIILPIQYYKMCTTYSEPSPTLVSALEFVSTKMLPSLLPPPEATTATTMMTIRSNAAPPPNKNFLFLLSNDHRSSKENPSPLP